MAKSVIRVKLLRSDRERRWAVRAGLRIEGVAVSWMIMVAVIAIGAGLLARSVLLTAFGMASVIELVSGGILLWRLSTEVRGGSLERVELAEHRAAWVVGVGLSLLCVYVVASASLSLLSQTKPDRSIIGIALASAAVIGMPLLAWRKRVIATRIDSAALRGDAACSITCA